MGSDLAPILFILMAGISVYWSVSVLFAQNADAKALSWASGTAPEKSKSQLIEVSRTLVHQFTLQHALRVKSKSYRKSLERKILTSGLSNELNVDEFIGLQILWGVMLPIVLLILNFALQLGFSPLFIVVVVGPGGIMLPHLHANGQRKQRNVSVLADLPFFLDLMGLAVEAGLDFQGAVQRIVEKARGSQSVLAEELEAFLRDVSLGSSRAEALRSMARRMDIPEVSSFVNVIVDADSTGASIVKVLKSQSEQMRMERFVRAEKAGAQASQLILFPLMFLILPAVLIMVFAPVALQFMYGGG